jgi:Holliday junction DNA helicase RuvB
LNAKKLGLNLSQDELLEIAKRSKGTPRILNARLNWYQSFVSYHQNKSNVSIDEVFMNQGIDDKGLDVYDRMYLDVLKKHKMSPLGLKSISSLTGIAVETIENSVEPFLVRMGYVVRTPKGRIIGSV